MEIDLIVILIMQELLEERLNAACVEFYTHYQASVRCMEALGVSKEDAKKFVLMHIDRVTSGLFEEWKKQGMNPA
jgi:hypothetical protein